jgi:hypothetical protein
LNYGPGKVLSGVAEDASLDKGLTVRESRTSAARSVQDYVSEVNSYVLVEGEPVVGGEEAEHRPTAESEDVPCHDDIQRRGPVELAGDCRVEVALLALLEQHLPS